MINFRFHIISIVAIFLALGIGIIMGSTVIDRAIVDGLRSRIDVAESNSVKRKEDNDRLLNEAKLLNEQDTILAAHTVQDTLLEQSIYVLVLGDVSDDNSTEVVELGSVAGAQISSVYKFNDDFVKSNKSKLLEVYLKTADNKAPTSSTGDAQKVMLSYFENSLNTINEQNEDKLGGEVNYQSYLTYLESKSAYIRSNVFANPTPSQNTSFIVLIDKSKLDQKEYVSFVVDLQAQYPVTIGIISSDDPAQKPSRAEAVNKITSKTSNVELVDNAESPSGRATLILAHRNNIAGKQTIYGVSSSAKERAPAIQ